MPRGQYVRQTRDEGANGLTEPHSAEQVEPVALSQRATETRRERRRRNDGDIDRMASLALAIPPEVKARWDREGKVGRWFLDRPGRVAEARDDDWDNVPDMPHVAAGQEDENKLVLMEKYKDWHDDDEAGHQLDLKAREDALVAGTSRENRTQGDGLLPPEQVSRSLGRNRISRDRG
jgi:hypothetical protein